MLATQLNDIMKNGTIGRNAIICLKKYICNVVPTPPGRAPPANGRYARLPTVVWHLLHALRLTRRRGPHSCGRPECAVCPRWSSSSSWT